MLEELIIDRDAIGDAMVFCLNHADAAEDVRWPGQSFTHVFY